MSWTNWDEDTDDQANEVWFRGWLDLEFSQRGELKKGNMGGYTPWRERCGLRRCLGSVQ